jgi:protein O-mannosyl-transferase
MPSAKRQVGSLEQYLSTRATPVARRTVTVRRPPRPTAQEFFTSERFVLGALLCLATLIAYYPVFGHPFVNFDDPVYVVNNSHIRAGWDWETISWAFTTFYQFNWHPLTWLSHALDVRLFQLHPGGHHGMNLLLHIANVLLLYILLWRATGYAGRSAVVAGLFAVHPINVESVAWIAERKNLLSMFFFLLGMGAYRWYALGPLDYAREHPQRAGKLMQPHFSLVRYALMTLCFALGLMAKPQIITFPFLLLLWDYWPLGRMAYPESGFVMGTLRDPIPPGQSFGWLLKEKLPLFAICAASAAVTIVAQRAGGAMASLQNYPLSVRLTNAIVSYIRYLGKAAFPVKLAPLYPHPWQPLPMWPVISSLVALVAMTALVILARKRRYLLVGWFWFLVALVPMIGIVHVGNQAMADRYAYLPFIGLFLMVCWEISEAAERGETPVVALRAVSALLLVGLMVMNDRQLSYWANNEDLWRHTLAVTEANYIAHDNLAQVLMEKGDTEGAVEEHEAALAIYPDDPNSLLALAAFDHQLGNDQEAIARYQHVERITPAGPARAAVLSDEGMVYLDMQDNAAAQAAFEKAVAMDSQNVRGWMGLGMTAERSGDLQAAIENYKRANDIKPLRPTYLMLAKALDATGDASGAAVAREQAKLLPERDTTTQTYSGGILQK